MAAFSGGLSPNVVRTALDDVFFPEYDQEAHPRYATAETEPVFHQETADKGAVIWELFKGSGPWEIRQEEQDVPQGTPRVSSQKTFTVTNFAKSIDITKNLFDDQQHSVYEKMVRSMARRARTTRDKNAFAVFRNAFSTATTSDAVSLINDSHTNLAGTTIDNRVTGAFSETTLETAITQLLELRAHDDEIDGSLAKCLLVPPALFKEAIEVTQSELRSGTPDNDINVYLSEYGFVVYTSPYIGTAAGGSDTAWFLQGDGHSVYRFVRQGIVTDLVDYKYQRNNNYVYKGEFREVVGAMDFTGIVGSTG